MKSITHNGLVSKTDKNYMDTTTAVELSFGGSKRRGSGCMSVDIVNGRVRFGKELYEALNKPEAVKVKVGADYIVYTPVPMNTARACVFGKGGVLYYPKLADKVAELAGINVDEATGSISVGTYQLQETDDPDVHEAVVSF